MGPVLVVGGLEDPASVGESARIDPPNHVEELLTTPVNAVYHQAFFKSIIDVLGEAVQNGRNEEVVRFEPMIAVAGFRVVAVLGFSN